MRLQLTHQSIWREARSVLFYVPHAEEPDLWPLATDALASGRQVALPRFSPATGQYVACRIRTSPGDLVPGQFGILEPTADCPIFDVKQLDLALVPGIGFSLAGGRLGRGKGYYDRLLAEVPGCKCGVAFDCQVTAEWPLEPHDVRVNCLLTPTRWYAIAGQARF
jgi:5-formyltetrahydrofolate cyclo-ligase